MDSRHKLIGRTGKIAVGTAFIPVEILSVDPKAKCPKCGGEWGSTVTLAHAMIGFGNMVLKGTTAEGCLGDVILDSPPSLKSESE